MGRAFLLGPAAPLQGFAQQVHQPQQQGRAQQHEETEEQGDAQQDDRADGQAGRRRGPDDEGHGDGADPPGVLRGDVRQLSGQPALLRAAFGRQDTGGQLGPEVVCGRDGGALTGAGAVAEAVGEPDVDEGQDAEPQQQPGDVAVHDPAVDGEPDDDGHEGLAGLMPHAQHRADDDIPALPAHRAPQDVPSRQVRSSHASSGPDPQRSETLRKLR